MGLNYKVCLIACLVGILLTTKMGSVVFAQSAAQQAAQKAAQEAAIQAAEQAAKRAKQPFPIEPPPPPPPVTPQPRCWWRGWGYFCMADIGENRVAIAACKPTTGPCEVLGEVEGNIETVWQLAAEE